MLLALPKRRARGACLAAALLSSVPANAQTGGAAPATGAPSDAKKGAPTDKQQPAEGAAPKTDEQASAASAPPAEAEPKKENEEQEDDEKEATRAIFMSGDLAFTRVDLGGISDNLALDKEGANGLLYGLAAGLRLKGLRMGARWRVFGTSEYDLWTVSGTIGYGLPLRPLSPILSANVGYVWDQSIQQGAFSSSLPPGTILPPDVNVRGLVVGLDLNAAYWLTKFLRLGAFIGTDFFFLSRERADLPVSIFPIDADFRNKPLFTESGSGVSYTINIGLRGAFDVGF